MRNWHASSITLRIRFCLSTWDPQARAATASLRRSVNPISSWIHHASLFSGDHVSTNTVESIRSHSPRALPDYLPARMINEFVYCPRLFFYEQVQGAFVESADTIEGSFQHRRVDKECGDAPAPPAPDEESIEPVIVRSITLSSDQHKVIAKLDLAEFAEGKVAPVDYKHGRPMAVEDGYEAWPAD